MVSAMVSQLLMLPLIIMGGFLAAATAAVSTTPPKTYKNITLTSPIMSVRVFMPEDNGISEYYRGSRFDHGSMVGDITFGKDRRVYGRGLWRVPHDPVWPESGVGLASEFGCGDDGASCEGKGDITNGVLGHETAKVGEPFLKIGVGALIKGSCPDCSGDDNGDYKFNSPYKFYRPPSWRLLSTPGPNEVTFVSEETVGDFGYRIQKTTRLDGDILTVRSILTNLGKKQFNTPWYSHHFFTGDDDPVGPGYVLDLGLSQFGLLSPVPQFRQPGLGSWSGDINDYANVTMARDGSISMKITKIVPEGIRLKANFLDENTQTLTDGSFTVRAPNGISVSESIPELQTNSRNPFIYGYNVYAEHGTISPEPMLLLYLNPGETTFWTQRLKFRGTDKNQGSFPFLSMFATKVWEIPFNVSSGFAFMLLAACLGMVVASYTRFTGSRTRRFDYSSIPDRPSSERKAGVVLSVV